MKIYQRQSRNFIFYLDSNFQRNLIIFQSIIPELKRTSFKLKLSKENEQKYSKSTSYEKIPRDGF